MATAGAAVGDVVHVRGHGGVWVVRRIRRGQSLIENTDGHRIAAPTASLQVLRKVDKEDPVEHPAPVMDRGLFDVLALDMPTSEN